MSGGLVDKVYIGLDNAPAAFDIKGRILGPNGTNLEYIRSETGVVAVLKTDKLEPLHLALHHTRSEALTAARSLAQNLIETIRAELAQWSAAQAGGPPPALNVPPPTLSTSSAPPPVPPPASAAISSPPTLTSSAQPAVVSPVVSVAPATTPLMTVRQPTVLQLLPQQQQYVLNQENGQLIPIVQPGMQMSNANFTQFPISLQQPNFGATQIVDISNMQPVNVTQLRFSGVPSSMSMILPNGITIPQGTLTSNDTTTVSSATSTPVVCAAQSTNASQKILYSTDKGDKEVKYHIQAPETVQWTMPGSQTMLIPYQQFQDLTANQQGLTNLQPQQFVSIAPAGGLQQTSLPLTAAQLHQLQATGTIMHFNQKSAATAAKGAGGQEPRGQKRLADGSPTHLQLRPIAPAGSHVSQERGGTREGRAWAASGPGRETAGMGVKINPHGTIIHVSSGQQTNVSAAGVTSDGMYIRQIDRNSIQIQSKDQKQDLNKMQSAQNVQMITVPQGMTVLQNPLNIGQMPAMLGPASGQVYMIPANQGVMQGGVPQGLLGQQQLLPGQNVTVMQQSQLGVGVPPGVQYGMPLVHAVSVPPPGAHYVPPGISLGAPLSAQQLATLPLVQAPQASSPLAGAQAPVSQAQVHQMLQQNSFLTPTSFASVPQQYMMGGAGGGAGVQYAPAAGEGGPPADNDSSSGATNQTEYITSSQEGGGYAPPATQNPAQTFVDGSGAQPGFAQQQAPPAAAAGYGAQGAAPAYPAPGASQAAAGYGSTPPSNTQTTQRSFSPSTTPAPSQTYQTQTLPGVPNVAYPTNQNPYPNATGQNLAAYASNQYQYNSRPWFRPRYGSPQGSPYSSGAGPPPAGAPVPVPPPSGNYNYWQDS